MSLFGRIGLGYIPFAGAFWGFGLPRLGDSLSANVGRAGFTLLGWGNAIVDTDPWRIASALWAPWSLPFSFGYFLGNKVFNPFADKIYDPFAQSSETYSGGSGSGASSTQAADQKKEEAGADTSGGGATNKTAPPKGVGKKGKGPKALVTPPPPSAPVPGSSAAASSSAAPAGAAAAPGTTGTPPSGAPAAAKPKREEKIFDKIVANATKTGADPSKTIAFSSLSATEIDLKTKTDADSKKLQQEVSKISGSKVDEVASIVGYTWQSSTTPHYIWVKPIGVANKDLAYELYISGGKVKANLIGALQGGAVLYLQ